ncbi:Ankyrin repeat protein 1 [Giardia muris]|uniref:Ankyrin repeat protein 1 n=1 Tax=Giardia muris TaxID=5742 RepID=A0A4Z1SYB6_GIAMU|nr:Ankyrin repeat protein 1 [Giardia muris]|eukprot:TNJ30686.1 Ankyrin repeat protein 1 [Giardia muris]
MSSTEPGLEQEQSRYLGPFLMRHPTHSGVHSRIEERFISHDYIRDPLVLRLILERVRAHVSQQLVRIIEWEETQAGFIIRTTSARWPTLSSLYLESRFSCAQLPEHLIWSLLCTILLGLRAAQNIRKETLGRGLTNDLTLPLIDLQSFVVTDEGVCQLDVLTYLAPYLFHWSAMCDDLPRCIRSQFLLERATLNLFETFSLPPLSFYIRPGHTLSGYGTLRALLQAETYMVGRLLVLLAEPGMHNYTSESLYFTRYSMTMTIIGYRLLSTDTTIRFSIGDMLLHPAIQAWIHHLRLSSPHLEEHRIGSSQDTPLMVALKEGIDAIIPDALENYVGMTNAHGKTALMFAVEHERLEAIPQLLNAEARMQTTSHSDGTYGTTALMLAVLSRTIACVKLLLPLEAGLQRADGTTALMLAATACNLECALLLLPYEAGLRDKDGMTALMRAAACHLSGSIYSLLAEKEARLVSNSGEYAIHIAARSCNIQGCIRLAEVEDGCRNQEGYTALMLAAKHNASSAAAVLLVEAGATTDTFRTALMIAAMRNNVSVVKLLSCELGMQDKFGTTALMLAASSGYEEAIAALLQLDSKVEQGPKESKKQDSSGWSALMHAARNGHIHCVRLLIPLEAGLRTPRLQTALSFAVRWGHVDIVRLLLPLEAPILSTEELQTLRRSPDIDHTVEGLIRDWILHKGNK